MPTSATSAPQRMPVHGGSFETRSLWKPSGKEGSKRLLSVDVDT